MPPLNVSEPIFDVAQLAHVELLTPDLEGTLRFFKELLGMQQTERRAGSAYLRGYEEHYHHSSRRPSSRPIVDHCSSLRFAGNCSPVVVSTPSFCSTRVC